MTPAGPLVAALAEARSLGFLGPGPIDAHVEHAQLLASLAAPLDDTWLDLGSGGGVPGLVWLSMHLPKAAVLVDANVRRCEFLTRAVDALGASDRVRVRCGRAEALAREPELRANFPLVVARSFGPPATTAECAAGFLGVPGRLVVSEPPPGPDGPEVAAAQRWPDEGLAGLGYASAEIRRGGDASVAVIRRSEAADERWPRRDGVPMKRPLW